MCNKGITQLYLPPTHECQPQGITALWFVLIVPAHEGMARLSWPWWMATYRGKCPVLTGMMSYCREWGNLQYTKRQVQQTRARYSRNCRDCLDILVKRMTVEWSNSWFRHYGRTEKEGEFIQHFMYKLLISKAPRYGPRVTRGSHSFTCHPHTNNTYLYSPAARHHRPLAGTHCAYPRRDGQAALTWVAGYIPR